MSAAPSLADLERNALARVWRTKRLWGLHLVANAVLVGLFYAWLWVPDERALELVASVMLGLAILFLSLWLHGGTLAFFVEAEESNGTSVWLAFRKSLRRLPYFSCWVALLVVVLWIIALVDAASFGISAKVASALTLWLRHPVHPQGVTRCLAFVFTLLRWVVVPAVLLPFAIQSLSGNPKEGSGLRRAWQNCWRKRYWLDFIVLVIVGAYVPQRLMGWIPKLETLGTQTTSLGVRLSLAYLLAISSWLVLVALAGRIGSSPRTNN